VDGYKEALYFVSNVIWVVSMIMSIVGAAIHFVVLCILLVVPDRAHAMKLWNTLVQGMPFERPGSALRYLLAPVVPEMYSLYCFAARRDTQRLFAMQLFVLGGVSTFDRLMLASPRQMESQFSLLMCVEPIFFIALLTVGDQNSTTIGWLLEAAKLAIGANLAGFLWALLTTRILRALRLAKLCAPPPDAKGA